MLIHFFLWKMRIPSMAPCPVVVYPVTSRPQESGRGSTTRKSRPSGPKKALHRSGWVVGDVILLPTSNNHIYTPVVFFHVKTHQIAVIRTARPAPTYGRSPLQGYAPLTLHSSSSLNGLWGVAGPRRPPKQHCGWIYPASGRASPT